MIRTSLIVVLTLSTFACGGDASKDATKPMATNAATPTETGDTTATPVDPTKAPKAPNFTLPDLDGAEVELASFAGKTVVLEWFNPGCPFVKYAHAEGPLKELAQKHAANGVVWLAINSGAPGNQGHGAGANKSAAAQWSMGHPILMDEMGVVGKLYGATSTPAMYVINPDGNLIYKGALDNAPLGKVEGETINYVDAALEAAAAGTMPATPETASYGCSVKYAQN